MTSYPNYDLDALSLSNREILFYDATTQEEVDLDELERELDEMESEIFDEESDYEAESETTDGIVYILTNESMPGILKIGKTSRGVTQRVSELNSTGVPTPFECHNAAFVSDMHAVEQHLHEVFKEHRVNKGREYFRIDARQVQKELSNFSTGDATFS